MELTQRSDLKLENEIIIIYKCFSLLNKASVNEVGRHHN